ncbi:MAG: 4Fe-4S binding protein [Candidatus Aegiribacteria sp.]
MWTLRFSPEDRFRRERCTGCGTCRRVCPSGAVRLMDNRPVFDPGKCIGCAHCGIFCPENAFGLDPVADPDSMPSPKEYRTLLERRRSIRFYSDKVPSEDQIKELVSVVDQCPTGRNSQGITVRAVRGFECVEELFRPVRRVLDFLSPTGIPFLLGRITGMGDHMRRIREGEDLVFRGAPAVLFFFVPRGNVTGYADGVIAATAVSLHGVSMGMGTLWNGVAQKLYPFFRSWHPSGTGGMRLAAVLCVGYPSVIPLRNPPPRSFELRIDECDSPKEGSSC